MQSFDDFYKQEILDEADIKAAIMNKAKSMSANIVKKAKNLLAGLDFERKETMFMLETFFKKLRELLSTEKTITDEDVKRALKQLGDVAKFSLIAPLFILPGGGTTTAVLYMTAKKLFNISILPQGLEQVFETMYDLKESLAKMTQLNEGVMQEFSKWVDNKKEKSNLDESLSRVYQHFNSDRPIGLLSAFRGEYPLEENTKRNYELAKLVRSAGYGFVWVDGTFIENKDKPNEEHVSEVSLMVVGKNGQEGLKEDLVKWARQFDQEAVVFKPESEQKIAYLIGQRGEIIKTMRNQKFDKIATVYTRLRRGNHAGRTFVLEGIRDQKGFASAMIENSKTKQGEI